MTRSKNPWVGKPSKTSEPSGFGGRAYYIQVAWFDGKKQRNKKFYYRPEEDHSEAEKMKEAERFAEKKTKEINEQQPQTQIQTA